MFIVVGFGSSSVLAAAYGIAVTGTMMITSIMFYVIIRETWNWPQWKALPLLVVFLIFDSAFLIANLTKFLSGGYVPLLTASAVGAMMLIWKRGRAIIAARNTRHFASTTGIERDMAEPAIGPRAWHCSLSSLECNPHTADLGTLRQEYSFAPRNRHIADLAVHQCAGGGRSGAPNSKPGFCRRVARHTAVRFHGRTACGPGTGEGLCCASHSLRTAASRLLVGTGKLAHLR